MNTVRFLGKRYWLLLAVLVLALAPSLGWAATKNVIVMIADGAGFNTWNATSMYQGKWDAAKGQSTQVYDGAGWVKYACCTYPLTTSHSATNTEVQDPKVVYQPAKAWDPQKGYSWLKDGYTDSAAAATALSTGQRTYDHAINFGNLNKPVGPTMSEAGKAAGKAVGVITTVPWSHATPAGFSNAHVPQRNSYADIAKQMLEVGVMDVIMGAGNPDFDNDGKKHLLRKDYQYVGGEPTWKALEGARAQPGGLYRGFRPVSTKAEFESLLTGPLPAKVVGTAQVGSTLQQSRKKGNTDDPALDTPLTSGLPDLAILATGALRVLNQNPKGFCLMIEGGAVDWANHANQSGRMIQEHMDYNRAVEAVIQWVNANSNWDETLLVLTADHETGLLWGSNSDKVPFDPIVSHGPGKMPGLKYHSRNHSNSLVPVFARGAGSEMLRTLVVGKDPIRGEYVENIGVAKMVHRAIAPATPAAGQR